MSYLKPENRVHRGFLYLDDEAVINSLSAVESGKIDEVVSKIASARDSGFGGGLGAYGAKIEGSKKSSASFEDEIVRTRTRFSVFELWYQNLRDAKAIGRFDGWGPSILSGVEIGDTVEMRAEIAAAPVQNLIRSFLWFSERASVATSFFAQSGDELKSTKAAARILKEILGSEEGGEALNTTVYAKPLGDSGPVVAMALKDRWTIGDLGELGGVYTIIAQVDRILDEQDELPTFRLIHGLPSTPLEAEHMKTAIAGFEEPAKEFGLDISANEAAVVGPGLWLSPLAIFR